MVLNYSVQSHRNMQGLTAQLNPDEVVKAQVFKEDTGGGSGLEEKGHIERKLCLQRHELQI